MFFPFKKFRKPRYMYVLEKVLKLDGYVKEEYDTCTVL